MSARYEIVRTSAKQPWHARFVAGNGRIVFTSEQYARRRGAERAVLSIVRGSGHEHAEWRWNVPDHEAFLFDGQFAAACAHVLVLDERIQYTPVSATITIDSVAGNTFTSNTWTP